ncbi:hypothetical protein [Bradyrhizobium japonicum]|uniref:hypothetical protein n=1 Tax=Bradyrhizobium japonicum TaxID=375 RepID=UPI001BAC21AB|nr:hypothetical protein [Bradyrhizobium japonicum]MBR0962246.1 hypothetical protein [Bradyrhizobium japonicum]
MFFVVRTDVSAQDGMQRVFGAFDTRAEAERFMVTLQAHMRGEFAVYEASKVS